MTDPMKGSMQQAAPGKRRLRTKNARQKAPALLKTAGGYARIRVSGGGGRPAGWSRPHRRRFWGEE